MRVKAQLDWRFDQAIARLANKKVAIFILSILIQPKWDLKG
jgi:hypothetical protein